MKRIAITLLCCIRIAQLGAQQPGSSHFKLYIGSYAGKDSTEESIYIFDFNAHNGALTKLPAVKGIENPSYLALAKDGSKLYAVSELGKGRGRVNAFDVNPHTGALSFVNSTSSGGSGPCYVSVDSCNNMVFAANYGSGSLSACHVLGNGSLDTAVQVIQHTGKSIKTDQQGPHVHSVVLSPDNRYLLSADLGVDKIYVYRADVSSSAILDTAAKQVISVKPGSGPRHIVFHPNGKFVYVVNEISGSVSVFGYQSGTLTFLQDLTMLPAHYHGLIEGADLHLSADGRFLYSTNREERNELLIYAVGTDGKLTYSGRHSTLGKGPRSFAIDPSGRFLLIANLNSNDIEIFSRNAQTGQVSFTGNRLVLQRPACLKFNNGQLPQ